MKIQALLFITMVFPAIAVSWTIDAWKATTRYGERPSKLDYPGVKLELHQCHAFTKRREEAVNSAAVVAQSPELPAIRYTVDLFNSTDCEGTSQIVLNARAMFKKNRSFSVPTDILGVMVKVSKFPLVLKNVS